MEIIKQGKLPEEKLYRGVCSYCGTIVKFMQKEAERMGASFGYQANFKVTCPLKGCGRPIYGYAIPDTGSF